jgi:deaminated glutathione amidase
MQAGRHNEKRESYGHAIIIDPWGRVLADAGADASPTLITAELGAYIAATVSSHIQFPHLLSLQKFCRVKLLVLQNGQNQPSTRGHHFFAT